jgi:DNA polymerase-3 subunit alpha
MFAVICTDKKNQDNGFQIPVLAKTKKGYHNLGETFVHCTYEGFYYVPRSIETMLEFKEDLIILSGGVYGEVAGKFSMKEKKKQKKLLYGGKKISVMIFMQN